MCASKLEYFTTIPLKLFNDTNEMNLPLICEQSFVWSVINIIYKRQLRDRWAMHSLIFVQQTDKNRFFFINSQETVLYLKLQNHYIL